MNEEEMKNLISNLIKDELQNQLLQVGAAKSYGGIPKPTNSRFPGSIGNKISSGELYNSIQVDFGGMIKFSSATEKIFCIIIGNFIPSNYYIECLEAQLNLILY